MDYTSPDNLSGIPEYIYEYEFSTCGANLFGIRKFVSIRIRR